MNAADICLLNTVNPDLLLTLLAARLLRDRSRKRQRIEADIEATGGSAAQEKGLRRAVSGEKIAHEALDIMLAKLGPLPELDENFEFAIVESARRARALTANSRTVTTVAQAAALLGA